MTSNEQRAAEILIERSPGWRSQRTHSAIAAALDAAEARGAEQVARRMRGLAEELRSWPSARILSPHDAADRIDAALADHKPPEAAS